MLENEPAKQTVQLVITAEHLRTLLSHFPGIETFPLPSDVDGIPCYGLRSNVPTEHAQVTPKTSSNQ